MVVAVALHPRHPLAPLSLPPAGAAASTVAAAAVDPERRGGVVKGFWRVASLLGVAHMASAAPRWGRRRRTKGRLHAARGRGRVIACAAEDPGAATTEAIEAPPRRQRVLSGIQPTGDLHLGNYFGAIKQWVGMQDDYDCFFCIVDLHAITVPHKPKELRKATMTTAAAYLASGINPAKSTVFIQSEVRAHAQLSWLLNTQTPLSWLEQATQYKEKALKLGQSVGMGLFAYPVLMAADILLYQADKVPVGEDQLEHLYLTRDIAGRINREYTKTAPKGRRLLRLPEALVGKQGARVMSLDDGRKKMSKSAPNPDSRIAITDHPSDIRRKIKRATTDSILGTELGNPDRPECTNLLGLYALATGRTPEEAAAETKNDNWGIFKGKLTEALIEYLAPIQSEYDRILKDPAFLKDTLRKGKARAEEVANQTLANVEHAMGFGLL